jgi:hypothetical protein
MAVFACKMLGPKRFLLVLASLVLILVATWKHYAQAFALKAVPDAFQVRSIIYANEESWGFVAGGNEA